MNGRWLLVSTGISLLLPATGRAEPRAAASQVAQRRKPDAARAPGTVLVRSTTEGASVLIDGRPVGTVPLEAPLSLPPGPHLIRVSRPGFSDYIDTFEVKPGRRTTLEVDLLPATGVLRVTSQPGDAAVVVDGRQLGITPYEGELEPGQRVLELRAPGYSGFRRALEVSAGESYPFDVTLVPVEAVEPSPEWYERWYVWAGAAAVVASGITAAVLLTGDDAGPAEPPYVLRVRTVP